MSSCRVLPGVSQVVTLCNTDDLIAAVHPADLTCRAQLVPDDSDSCIRRVLTAYAQRTGQAVLLNTSLNLHGKPIACTATDALDVFTQSSLRHMQLGPYLVRKP